MLIYVKYAEKDFLDGYSVLIIVIFWPDIYILMFILFIYFDIYTEKY